MLYLFAEPECFAFRSAYNGNYLHTVYRKKAGGSHIEATAGSTVANARTKFFVEPSKEHDSEFVHVRCCYNNKYWVPEPVQDSGGSGLIIGTTNEPDEEINSRSCTLFKPMEVPLPGNGDWIRFFHSALGKFVCVSPLGDKPQLELRDEPDRRNAERGAGSVQENNWDVFTVIGLPRRKELPRHVAFKGDNDKYLGTKHVAREPSVGLLAKGLDFLDDDDLGQTLVKIFGIAYQQFHTKDIGDASVIHIVFTNDDGTVRIKSNQTGRFWRRNSDDWILADSDDQDCKDRDTLFEVVHGDGGFIALRNLGNNKLCRRLDAHAKWYDIEDKITALSACDDSISKWARLTLAAPVVSREITDVEFHTEEARVYKSDINILHTEHRTNATSSDIKSSFSYVNKIEMESKWERSVSSKFGVEASINASTAGGIPFIVGGEVTVSRELTSSHGETKTEGDKRETTTGQEFTVKPMTVATVKFVATRGRCDVPYSYTQTDVLTTGKTDRATHDDGIYTCENNYDFHIIITEAEYKGPAESYKLSGTK